MDEGVAKWRCGQTFNFVSERDLNMKLWLHHKVCTKPSEGSEQIRTPKKAMTLKEAQRDKVERANRFHERC